MPNIPESSPAVTSTKPAIRSVYELLTDLQQRFPVLAEFKPLKLKIHLDIRAALEGEGIANIRIARALGRHIHHPLYQKALAKGGARYNLAGEIDGEVTNEQRQAAKARRKQKKPKPPQGQTSPAEPSAPPEPVAPSPVDTPPPVPTTRPILKLKPKAGSVTTATVTHKEAKP